MSQLTDTIHQALTGIGEESRSILKATVSQFETLDLGDEERVSAIATAIAAAARASHQRHAGRFGEALRAWALELAGGHRMPPRLRDLPEPARIAMGAERLVGGLQHLLIGLATDGASLTDRVAVELTLFSRLLAGHDAATIHLAVEQAVAAIDAPGYRPGDLVAVPLRDQGPIERTSPLDQLPVRGTA